MAINVKINTLNFDNKLKDCSSRRATEDHVTIRKTRGYKAKLGLGFFITYDVKKACITAVCVQVQVLGNLSAFFDFSH